MALLDPSTNQPLPADAIQRILFIANTLHVYNIPPLTSIKGHSAASWTADPARHIFTARLRVVETSSSSSSFSNVEAEAEAEAQAPGPGPETDADAATDNLKVDIVLEDPATGQLFAAAPYTDPAVVEPVLDSSRFFALTVRDPQGRKATLGIGFEERSEAFDLAIVLQEARRVLGMEARAGIGAEATMKHEEDKGNVEDKDYSLKEGETITVKIGKNMGRRREPGEGDDGDGQADEGSKPLQAFALPPPPPPSSNAGDVKRKRRSLKQLGFDDGQFGEFS
ncbi:hypothetical protein E4U54_004915 [Claviceps lovelessii]|nr:hypothetical protein E4U54_004915 [Claviceps lovelessii]